MCWFPSYVWTASLWVAPPPWLGSLANQLMSWMYESCTIVLSYALTPSTAPWMFIRVSVVFTAHTPSRHGLGKLGAISVSWIVALAPESARIQSTAELH